MDKNKRVQCCAREKVCVNVEIEKSRGTGIVGAPGESERVRNIWLARGPWRPFRLSENNRRRQWREHVGKGKSNWNTILSRVALLALKIAPPRMLRTTSRRNHPLKKMERPLLKPSVVTRSSSYLGSF